MMGKITIKDFSFEGLGRGVIALRHPGREYWLYTPVDLSEAYRLQKEIGVAIAKAEEYQREARDAE